MGRVRSSRAVRQRGALQRNLQFLLIPMHPATEGCDRNVRQLEAAARSAIEARANRKLTDSEWSMARARLLKFAEILWSWERTKIRLSKS